MWNVILGASILLYLLILWHFLIFPAEFISCEIWVTSTQSVLSWTFPNLAVLTSHQASCPVDLVVAGLRSLIIGRLFPYLYLPLSPSFGWGWVSILRSRALVGGHHPASFESPVNPVMVSWSRLRRGNWPRIKVPPSESRPLWVLQRWEKWGRRRCQVVK